MLPNQVVWSLNIIDDISLPIKHFLEVYRARFEIAELGL